MTFTEVPFWILAAATFAFWRFAPRNERASIALLLTASLVFYGYHHWRLLFLILLYCLVDWGAALAIVRSKRPALPLALGVAFNLLMLAYWKYTPLLLATAAQVAPALGLTAPPRAPVDWVIPFGISFYAFTGVAYLVDVYRGVTQVETS